MLSRTTISILAGAGMLLPLLAAGNSFGANDTDSQDFTQIERGRYLVVAADCAACHTVPDHGQPFAGGRPIETPFGNITSANITVLLVPSVTARTESPRIVWPLAGYGIEKMPSSAPLPPR